MWNWLKKRKPKPSTSALLAQAEGAQAIIAQLCEDNAELRAIVVSLDNACTRLSVQLYGQEAVDRVIAQARRSDTN